MDMRNTRSIFLIRHARSEWNGQKRITGQLDPPLSVTGVQQSLQLERLLRGVSLSAIYASPLCRSAETAKPTANFHGLNVQTCDALKEIHFGILQGRFRDSRDPQAQRIWEEREKDKLHYRVPGGETFLELERRVVPCLSDILKRAPRRAVLIVGHRNTNRVIMGKLMQWNTPAAVELDLRSKYVYEVVPGGKPQIVTYRLDNGFKYEGFKM